MHIGDEVTARITKASMAFGRPGTNVWERNGIKIDIKLKVFKDLAGPLYACVTWTVYQHHAKRLSKLFGAQGSPSSGSLLNLLSPPF